jgi:GntR family transcriptional regulator, transcriptional repressor for pyruvate dehydrogenase complex
VVLESAPLVPVLRRTIADEVRDRLETAIRNGQLTPGEPLPAERVLCVELGVARTSVREALRSLQGNRSLVADPLPLVMGNGDSRKRTVREVFETRRLIEVGMVRLTAERATKKDRVQIVRLAERFTSSMPIAEFRRLDRHFHWTIASTCRNEMIAELYRRVLAALFSADEFESLLSDTRNNDEVSRIVEVSGDAHRAIACAIAAGDADRAAAEMTLHLDEVERRMIEQLV